MNGKPFGMLTSAANTRQRVRTNGKPLEWDVARFSLSLCMQWAWRVKQEREVLHDTNEAFF